MWYWSCNQATSFKWQKAVVRQLIGKKGSFPSNWRVNKKLDLATFKQIVSHQSGSCLGANNVARKNYDRPTSIVHSDDWGRHGRYRRGSMSSNYLTNVKNGYLTNSSLLIPAFLVLAVSSLGTGELRSSFRLARATINRLNKFPTRSVDYITLGLWRWTGAQHLLSRQFWQKLL